HYSGLAPMTANGPDTTGRSGTASYTGLSSGVVAGSRIGLKGTEDLGGGLKAMFQAETGFCAAGTNQTGAPGSAYCTGGGFMGRTTMLGLQGSFGTVKMGRYFSTMFDNEINYDPFQAGFTGAYSNLSLGINGLSPTGTGGNATGSAVSYLLRTNQTISYISPNLSGLTVQADYSFNDGEATDPLVQGGNTTKLWSLNGNYAFGAATVGANYTKVTNVTAANGTIGSGLNGAYKTWQLFGSYDLQMVKLSAIYERGTADYFSGNDSSWLLGATVPVGPGAVMVSYSQYGTSLAPTGTSVSTSKAKQYAIGYSYNLSKRTMLYTSFAHMSNDSASANRTGTALAVNDATNFSAGVTGQSSNGFAVGILHSF
ncbi:MAG: porin, partial [Thiomonas sp.]